MSIDSLLESLESQCVTPVTRSAGRGVTPKSARALDCTPVTRVTPQGAAGAIDVYAQRWLIRFADREPLEVTFAPAATHAEALGSYLGAVSAEPMPEPTVLTMPSDLIEMVGRCADADLYCDCAHGALCVIVAADTVTTRALVAEMRGRTARCLRCEHFRRPGSVPAR